MITWHPKVHRHFQESLYFYLLRVHSYNRESFRRSLLKHLAERDLSAYCIYEVYGAHDIMLRIWLPEEMAESFHGELRTNPGLRITQILPFRVSEQLYYWRWDDDNSPPPTDLDVNTLTPEKVRAIRDKSDSRLKKDFNKRNLLREIRPNRSIKCFIGVSPPETPTDEATGTLLNRIRAIVKTKINKKELSRFSLYCGAGFAWSIVKIEATQFYNINSLTVKLWEELISSNGHTHTHIVSNADYSERDDISDAAIRAVSGKDLVVNSFIPYLYEHEVETAKLRKIEELVRTKVIHLRLAPEDERSIRAALVGIIDNDEDQFAAVLFAAFSKRERFLRRCRDHFINKILGENAVNRVLRMAKIDKAEKPGLLALGDLLNVYAATIKEAKIPESENLEGGWEQAAMLRNDCVHGHLYFDKDWESALTTFVQFLIRYRRLQETVCRVLTDKWKRKT